MIESSHDFIEAYLFTEQIKDSIIYNVGNQWREAVYMRILYL